MANGEKVGHTEGPLSVMDGVPEHYLDVDDGDDFYIVRIQDRWVRVHGQAWGDTPEEAMANGRLWAASPELLEELLHTDKIISILLNSLSVDEKREAVKKLCAVHDGEGVIRTHEREAAIAKATGKS